MVEEAYAGGQGLWPHRCTYYAGRLREQSRWHPNLIAFWLVDKGYMKAKVVKRIITRSFPDWADSVDYFIVD